MWETPLTLTTLDLMKIKIKTGIMTQGIVTTLKIGQSTAKLLTAKHADVEGLTTQRLWVHLLTSGLKIESSLY